MREIGWVAIPVLALACSEGGTDQPGTTDTAGSAKLQLEAQESALDEWVALGLEAYEASNYQEYPRDLLDGLITQDRIYAIVPSDQYPSP